VYVYGEGQARRLGIQEEDVDTIIHEFRQDERAEELTRLDRIGFAQSLVTAPESPYAELQKAAKRYARMFPAS
jgi:hypothetical protein